MAEKKGRKYSTDNVARAHAGREEALSSSRKIILHVGLPKTGTKAIQNVLHANREFLLQHEGVLYPSLAPNLSTPLSTIFRNDPLGNMVNKVAGLTTEEVEVRRKDYLESLDAEISSHEWNTLLLSAEDISKMSEAEVAKLREWGARYSSEWSVLVCVRHPVGWARSMIQQRLKPGETLQQIYEEPELPEYRANISNAISVFGRENVRVFDFDSAARGEGGIVGAFADQAGLTTATRDFLVSRAVSANESLSSEAVRILSSLNRQRPVFDGNARTARRAGPGHELPYLRRIEGRKFDVPDSVKKDIRLQSREDVAWLNETFGLDLYRDVTDSASPAEGQEEPVEALSDPAIDSIAEVFGELVTEAAFHRTLNGGKAALDRGTLEVAEKRLREAARLDPDAKQPKKLLEEVTAKQKANEGESSSQEKTDRRANRASFMSRLWR